MLGEKESLNNTFLVHCFLFLVSFSSYHKRWFGIGFGLVFEFGAFVNARTMFKITCSVNTVVEEALA